MAAHIYEQPPWPRSLNAGISPEFETLLMRFTDVMMAFPTLLLAMIVALRDKVTAARS